MPDKPGLNPNGHLRRWIENAADLDNGGDALAVKQFNKLIYSVKETIKVLQRTYAPVGSMRANATKMLERAFKDAQGDDNE